MLSSTLYDSEQSARLLSRADELVEFGSQLRAHRVEPTIDRRGRISETIFGFIRDRKRVLYGGHAMDAALDGEVYPTSEERSMADIEFYSPDAIQDLRALCDQLHADGHPYVQGKEAAHAGTFTISVSCVRICDITSVPSRVFESLPLLDAEGASVKTIHPHVCIIDLLRILCDPATSYWRLPRMLPRLLKLQQRYPAADAHPLTREPKGASLGASSQARTSAALAWAQSRSDTVAVMSLPDSSELAFVCTDYEADRASLFDVLGSHPFREYRGFLDCLSERTEIRGGAPTITLHNSEGRMVPTTEEGGGVRSPVFEYEVIHVMSMILLGQTRGIPAICNAYKRTLASLLRGDRSKSLTSLDRVNYIGGHRTDMQLHLDGTRRPWYVYSPARRGGSGRAVFPLRDGAPKTGKFQAWRGTPGSEDVPEPHDVFPRLPESPAVIVSIGDPCGHPGCEPLPCSLPHDL